ncbi:MAG: DUF4126 domain-containing protein [Desulfatibacillum sp.]|nr:DUF4126 domain-containing protein [Desulfatibacillum sp.]
MDDYKQIVDTIALSMGAAWASGVNLYAAILVLGLLGVTENIVLPETLQVLTEPIVLIAAGLMFIVEFVADKTPGVDTGWDAIHTFIRIPAGAALAAGAVGNVNPAIMVAAGIVGGGVAAATHATKAGTRVLINTSPEPVTNWIASMGEDVAVVAGLWAALNYPTVFIVLLIIFLLLLVWLLPKLWRGIKKVFGFIKRLFTGKKEEPAMETALEPVQANDNP